MGIKYLLPALAVAGVIFAVYSVFTGYPDVPLRPPAVAPAVAPYPTFISGIGVVEASTENLAVGAPLPGIVSAVYVKAGQTVKKGDPLFRLDDRDVQATLKTRQAHHALATSRLARLRILPRPEDIPLAEARLSEAQALFSERTRQWTRAAGLSRTGAISEEEIGERRLAAEVAHAQMRAREAELNLLRAGAWEKDLVIARLEQALAEAEVQKTQTALTLLTVRAPIAGTLLQVQLHPGESVPLADHRPLMLLGQTEPLAVRVEIDEHDVGRFRADARATAFALGKPQVKIPLVFSHVEPMLTPKRSLTGRATERVDTRVLQVIYLLNEVPNRMPIYIGQQLEVAIDAPQSPEPTTPVP